MSASCSGSSWVPHWCHIEGVQTQQEPIPWASGSPPLHSQGFLGRSIWLPEQLPLLSPITWSFGRLPRGSSKSSPSLALLHRGCQNAHPLEEIPSPRNAKPSLGSGARLYNFERLMAQGHPPCLISITPQCSDWSIACGLDLSFCCSPLIFAWLCSPRRDSHPPIPHASSVQFSSLSQVQLFLTPWTAAHQVSLSVTNSQSLLKLMSIELVMPSNHLILCCCSLLLLPSIFPSISVFSNESVLHVRWPKYWSFSFTISPSNEYSGLISFRIDWLDLPVVQGTLKSLLQHHSSKAPIFRCSAFFIVQFSHPYMTTGKAIALTRQTFVGKVMSLLFNMLSRFVIVILPRSKHLLIS